MKYTFAWQNVTQYLQIGLESDVPTALLRKARWNIVVALKLLAYPKMQNEEVPLLHENSEERS